MREHEYASLMIMLEIPVNYEIISWILGFGSAAEGLHPISVQKRIVEELEASLGPYRSRSVARTKIIPEKKVPAILS